MEMTVQLDDALLAAAKLYAEQQRRSLSQVVADALREKLSHMAPIRPTPPPTPAETQNIHDEVKRITGLAPANLDARALYREHVSKRHG